MNYEKIEVSNKNTIKIKNYDIENRGTMLYAEDFKELQEIPKKYKNCHKDINGLLIEIYEKLRLFSIGKEVELIKTGDELQDKIFDELINQIIIKIATKINREYIKYKNKNKNRLSNSPNMIKSNENIVNLILEDPAYETLKKEIKAMDINIILEQLNVKYDKEQKVEVLKKAIEEYSSNKRDLTNKYAMKASELYESLNISDHAKVLLYIIKNID